MLKTLSKAAVIAVLMYACSSGNDYVPKPRAYPRMDLPAMAYRLFDSAEIPYKCEIPVYSAMEKDSMGIYTRKPNWYNLNFRPFNATLHLTYHRFQNWNQFDSLMNDTRKLVNKHIQRAEDIAEEPLAPSAGVRGMLFEIEGNTATNLNFYLTDSAKHFVRGALYFNSQTSLDSTAPVFSRMKEDIRHLINTFSWR
jgi:gliding motility-associated lipoprotein GldD